MTDRMQAFSLRVVNASGSEPLPKAPNIMLRFHIYEYPILQKMTFVRTFQRKDTAQTFSVVASDEAHTGASLEAASILDGT